MNFEKYIGEKKYRSSKTEMSPDCEKEKASKVYTFLLGVFHWSLEAMSLASTLPGIWGRRRVRPVSWHFLKSMTRSEMQMHRDGRDAGGAAICWKIWVATKSGGCARQIGQL